MATYKCCVYEVLEKIVLVIDIIGVHLCTNLSHGMSSRELTYQAVNDESLYHTLYAYHVWRLQGQGFRTQGTKQKLGKADGVRSEFPASGFPGLEKEFATLMYTRNFNK